jgi:UDP-glucose 4-epimerase
VLDDLSTGDGANVPADAELLVGDVADAEATTAAVRDVDVVFHLAALGAVARSVEDPLATDTANVHGTLTVLHAARSAAASRVVFASSSSVYGGSAPLPTREDAPTRPRSPYAVSKLTGELYCRVFSELHGLETVALRFFNVYGPRQRPDSIYAAVVPTFLEALLSGDAPTVHGDGEQSRDFTFVGDVCGAILAAAGAAPQHCDGRAFNVARGRRASVLELLGNLAELVGVAPRPVHTAARAGDVRHSQADVTALARDLGYRCSVELVEGLGRTVAWALARRER